MGKKRILVVSQHYWPENFRSTDVCQGFTELGYEVDVLCGLPNYPKGEWAEGYHFFGPRKEVHNGVTLYRAGEIPRIFGFEVYRIVMLDLMCAIVSLCATSCP
ncbi:MAG: hypothetical protein PHZ05_08000, partial [Pygmaiobacter massiliensis]|nr:hypothetical protein [Pygmaiobacter massiliensis]